LHSNLFDFNGDGLLDLYVQFESTAALVYRAQTGFGLPQWAESTGSVFPGGIAAPPPQGPPSIADYDNNGDLDLLCATGTQLVNPDSYRRNRLYRNTGVPHYQFSDVAVAEGVGDACAVQGAWLAWGDLNGDGWLDIAATWCLRERTGHRAGQIGCR